MKRQFWLSVAFCLVAVVPAVAQPLSRAEAYRRAAAMTELGRQMFFDPALSASGKLSCATCHDAAHAFGPPDGRTVRLAGPDMHQPGLRAVPSLNYLQALPQFTEHFFDNEDEGDESIDNGPTGGLTWDGRVDRGRDQASLPLLSPFEMANASPAAVARKLRAAPYAATMRTVFGPTVLDDGAAALAALSQSLEVFEQDPVFYPYSSKYDAYLAGNARLTAAESRGLAAFDDPARGNCAHCHVSRRARDGTPPQFTDYGLVALGVPRNPAIPANADPRYFDLGLCGPLRTDLRDHIEYCGRFMTPTLRNVATRRVFMHNGAFHTLHAVLEFYAWRDTDPGRFYPRDATGQVRKYDDLPARYAANVNVEPPFGRASGGRPSLSEAEIDDIIVFLRTLTDGWQERRQRPYVGHGAQAAALRAIGGNSGCGNVPCPALACPCSDAAARK